MSKGILCMTCDYLGEPKAIAKGTMGVELIRWLCFVISGLIYSVWRLSSRHECCPSRSQTGLIPRMSPMAQKFLARIFQRNS